MIPSSGETSLDIATASCIKENDVIIGGDINIIRFQKQNGDFFGYYLSNFQNRNLARMAQGHSVVHLYYSHFKKLKINLPTLKEQQKIASFLTQVDEWIDNLKQQKEKLEEYKKGIMQKIFSQEVRFKNNDGKKFPDWEEKKLGEMFDRFSGLRSKTKQDFGEGEPYITYKQIFDSNKIDIEKFGRVRIGKEENQNKAQYGDILFTTSSETPLEAGFASVLLEKNIKPYLNSFAFGMRAKDISKFPPEYARFYFRSQDFRKKVHRLAQGSTRFNISQVDFMKTEISVPEPEEQQKIADFLTSIDKTIELKQEQISQSEKWKKGLMQKMFI